MRDITYRSGILETKQAKEGDSPYEMYYEHSEKLSAVPNHRVLAINRAEKEGYIRVSIKVDEALPLNYLCLRVSRQLREPPHIPRCSPHSPTATTD